MEEETKSAPIYRRREQLLAAIKDYNILIMTGDITSGKTTQIPQYLHEAGYTKNGKKKIGCTQPRDFAARSLATRVSKEMGVELGREVGYSTQFENCTTEETVIEYMSDKKLLQEFLDERKLESYSVLIVEEAHQRTVATDLLLGLLRNHCYTRSDLKVIISGDLSDVDSDDFSNYFNMAPQFRIRKNLIYPVEIVYKEGAGGADFLIQATSRILQIHETEPDGDVLVLLPGQEEIELVDVILQHKLEGLDLGLSAKLIVCPIFENLPPEVPSTMFEPAPAGARKVVLATDIAEAYLISNKVRYVIDMGLRKINAYNPMTGLVSLLFCPISKASAIQRADQAGRTDHGKCFRLYSASNYEKYMVDKIVPEMRIVDLAHTALVLKCLGIHHLMCFDFMEWPPIKRLLEAVDLLYALDAVDGNGKITDTGRSMAEFPLDPMLSKMILASEKYKCSAEIITIAAMLSVGNSIFYSTIGERVAADNARMRFYAGNVGDHIALLKVYNSWAAANFSIEWCHENYIQVNSMTRARSIRDQLEGLLARVNIKLTSNPNDLDAIKKAITSGFFYHFAKLQKAGYYRTVINPQTASLHPSPSLPQVLPRCIIYHEMFSEKGHLRQISEVLPQWLVEIAPRYYEYSDLEVVRVTNIPRGQWNASMY